MSSSDSRPKSAFPNPPSPIDELLDALSLEIARCAGRAGEHARLIEGAGALAHRLTAELYRDAPPSELYERAQGLQSLIHHGTQLLAELGREAGRLEGLATLRDAAGNWD